MQRIKAKTVRLNLCVLEACDLIAAYQMLARAHDSRSWEAAKEALYCLSVIIDTSICTRPHGLGFVPSAASPVMPSSDAGVLCMPDGEDFTCAKGLPCHLIISYGQRQCPKSCGYELNGQCKPEEMRILLSNGMYYRGCEENEEVFDTAE